MVPPVADVVEPVEYIDPVCVVEDVVGPVFDVEGEVDPVNSVEDIVVPVNSVVDLVNDHRYPLKLKHTNEHYNTELCVNYNVIFLLEFMIMQTPKGYHIPLQRLCR